MLYVRVAEPAMCILNRVPMGSDLLHESAEILPVQLIYLKLTTPRAGDALPKIATFTSLHSIPTSILPAGPTG